MNLPPADDLQITRILKAPRRQVFALWTDEDRAKEWWGPAGCETLELVSEARPGGDYRWHLRAPDGSEMTAHGRYLEVLPDAKLVYTWQWADEPAWANVESIVTVEFLDHPEGTELRLTHRNLPSEQSRNNHAEGWTSVLEKFSRLVSDQA